MSTIVDVPQISAKKPTSKASGPILTGVWQKVAVAAWAVIALIALLDCVLSITALNIWDRVPAAEASRYFADLPPDFVSGKAELQQSIQQMGISLAFFANFLTLFRILGSIALFALSVQLIRRYPRHLMGVLFAIMLAVMAAAGIWQNTLSGWSTLLAPWMGLPSQAIQLLLWFGLIFLYAFPDGHFIPRWTLALVVLLVPLVIALIFDLPVFFNPATWPDPLPLLPNLVFIGAAFFSILYRYSHADPVHKAQLRGYVLGVSLLMVMYFIQLFLIELFPVLTGQRIFNTNPRLITYVLVNEPLWYALEVVFAASAARSLFRERLLEG